MVARSPPKLQKKKSMAPLPPLDPVLLKATVDKVDKAIARLQELQFTVTGGEKVISGVTLSPRSTRGYLKTSLRCKQETLRMKNINARTSPGKYPTNTGDWRRMSLPAMLLGETVGEILQASKFARKIVETVDPKPRKAYDDPKTPVTQRRKQKPNPDNSELPARRKREKQVALQTIRSDSNPISLQRAKSRINFKVSSPLHKNECDKENCRYIANRVSPRNKPWVKKTVLFPNPMFHSSPTSVHQKFCRTKSPVIGRSKQTTPHKFLIKSPPSASKFGVKIRSPPLSISPKRAAILSKRSPPKVMSTAAKLRRSFSPSRLATKLASPLKSRKSVSKDDVTKMMISGLKQRSPPKVVKQRSPPKVPVVVRRSFSPSRLATKLVSPLRSRNSGLKQRPSATPMRIPAARYNVV